MLTLQQLSYLGEQALWLGLMLSAPAVGVAALVGLLVALLQAATQINDATIAHVPRFIAVVVALAISGGMMGRELTRFAERAFTFAL